MWAEEYPLSTDIAMSGCQIRQLTIQIRCKLGSIITLSVDGAFRCKNNLSEMGFKGIKVFKKPTILKSVTEEGVE